MSFESFLKKEKDKVVTYFREDEKHLKDLHATLHVLSNFDKITDGKRHFIGKDYIEIRQQPEDHLVYFGDGDEQKHFYRLLSYQWDGPQYETHLETQTSGSQEATTHRTHHLLGALIGTAIAPGVGTVIGGLEGTGSKTDTSTNSSSYTYPVQDEITTKATITLEDLESKDVFPVEFDCNSDLNDTLKKFYVFKPKPVPVSSQPDSEKMDPFQQVEELKKLLDEGIITQAEFDKKKKQLLDL